MSCRNRSLCAVRDTRSISPYILPRDSTAHRGAMPHSDTAADSIDYNTKRA